MVLCNWDFAETRLNTFGDSCDLVTFVFCCRNVVDNIKSSSILIYWNTEQIIYTQKEASWCHVAFDSQSYKHLYDCFLIMFIKSKSVSPKQVFPALAGRTGAFTSKAPFSQPPDPTQKH